MFFPLIIVLFIVIAEANNVKTQPPIPPNSQQGQFTTSSITELEYLRNWVNSGFNCAGCSFFVRADIGTPANPFNNVIGSNN
jgi:hypothetical protein